MADKKRIIMAGATLGCIGAIGFFMQGGMGKSAQPQPRLVVTSAGLAGTVPGQASPDSKIVEPVEISGVELTAADNELAAKPVAPVVAKPALPQDEAPQAEQPAEQQAASDAEQPIQPIAPVQVSEQPEAVSFLELTPASPPVEPTTRSEPEIDAQCDITMNGTEIAGALVKLSLSAPCLPNERVTMHHNGMMFTESTDDEGKLDLAVPALAENAVFIASFPNSKGAVANVNVTTLALYDRAVVQSEFSSGIGLHALEFGADYTGEGHIWSNAPGEVAAAATGKGGFMTLLGNPAISEGSMAQIYTFPSGLADRSGDVTLSTEIEVTNMNCGHEIEAQALEVNAGSQPKMQTLNLTMPDCDAVGDFLVLKNLLNDLKVAANSQ